MRPRIALQRFLRNGTHARESIDLSVRVGHIGRSYIGNEAEVHLDASFRFQVFPEIRYIRSFLNLFDLERVSKCPQWSRNIILPMLRAVKR